MLASCSAAVGLGIAHPALPDHPFHPTAHARFKPGAAALGLHVVG